MGIRERVGGWPTSPACDYTAVRFERINANWGAPLLALFEKWADTPLTPLVVLILCGRRSNLQLQHFPVVYFHRPSFPKGVRSKAAPLPKLGGTPPIRASLDCDACSAVFRCVYVLSTR